MAGSPITSDIVQLLKKSGRRRPPLLVRGNDERAFLAGWLREPAADRLLSSANEKDIASIIRSCEKCGAAAERKIGVGSGKNRVMIILNAPMLLTGLEKKVYRAESVELLKKMVAAMGLDFNECYVTNLVKCEISDSLIQPSGIVANCVGILAREIDHYRPEIVLVLGDLAPLQKMIKQSKNITWHNADHPITLLKNPELKRKAWETLKLVIARIKER